MAAECPVQPEPDDMPVGVIVAWPKGWDATDATSTSQWLLCDGGAIPGGAAGIYSELIALIGNNVPDLGRTFVESGTGADPQDTLTGEWPTSAADLDVDNLSHTHDGFTTLGDGTAGTGEGTSGGLNGAPGFDTNMQSCENYTWDFRTDTVPTEEFGWTESDYLTNDIGNGLAAAHGTAMQANAKGGHMHCNAAVYQNMGGEGTTYTNPSDVTGHLHASGNETGPSIGNAGGGSTAIKTGSGRNTEYGNLNIEAHRHTNVSTSTGTVTWGDIGTGGSIAGNRIKPVSVVMNYIIKGFEDP